MTDRIPIEPGRMYHLYNHSNGNLLLFRCEENYKYFLEKYIRYMHPWVDTFSYCLMPNHFHFSVGIRETERYTGGMNTLKETSRAIKKWLVSYSRSYNSVYDVRGNLFYQHIKRKRITDDDYFRRLISYIHLNPVIAGLTDDPSKWKYSSYPLFLSEKHSFIAKDEVLSGFDDLSNFRYYHQLCLAQKFAADKKLTF